ncbi:uncharacterized protein BDZ99DRAFT_232760 [Mytilinidion resinicola]|uniref:Uncharacterized protein n=1 Tax=Mytilinidion resinicola TaxID=574789 RepID=A0A6A6Z0F5_9PEZI|nr:uncharacterized protein BDZ99DRAFT_232760 [Mytilinidion resinicola]KAF2814183.1 hypothetical protein BDZ99DRAFT_232760 [Mytilinidion resinicola]
MSVSSARGWASASRVRVQKEAPPRAQQMHRTTCHHQGRARPGAARHDGRYRAEATFDSEGERTRLLVDDSAPAGLGSRAVSHGGVHSHGGRPASQARRTARLGLGHAAGMESRRRARCTIPTRALSSQLLGLAADAASPVQSNMALRLVQAPSPA